jgi:hypothetical protein
MFDETPTELSTYSHEELKSLRAMGNVAITALLLKSVVPNTETDLMENIEDLVKNDLVYRDPSTLCNSSLWFKLHKIVNTHIKDTDVEWRKTFIGIFTNNIE